VRGFKYLARELPASRISSHESAAPENFMSGEMGMSACLPAGVFWLFRSSSEKQNHGQFVSRASSADEPRGTLGDFWTGLTGSILLTFPLQCQSHLASDLQCDLCLNDRVHQIERHLRLVGLLRSLLLLNGRSGSKQLPWTQQI
jgi:hypothetical protein